MIQTEEQEDLGIQGCSKKVELWDILDKDGNKTGRVYKRGCGVPLGNGEYHLVVHVWVVNRKGEFLVSKRTPNKSFPNMWECTGGAAVSGDNSLQTALKEVKEELGIELNPESGEMLWEFILEDDIMNNIYNAWLFRQDVDINDVVLQEGETCDAALVDKYKIMQMIENGEFIGRDYFPYLDELFKKCDEYIEKENVLEKVYDFKFANPIKTFSSYKSEMTLSQVVTYLERQGIVLTKTMVQHYMKSDLLPPLINKRYYNKRHICALSIIHILKDIYSLDDIRAVFKPFQGENFEFAYDAFIGMYEEAISTWKSDLPAITNDLDSGQFGGENIKDNSNLQSFLIASLLMAQSAAAKELAKLMISGQ